MRKNTWRRNAALSLTLLGALYSGSPKPVQAYDVNASAITHGSLEIIMQASYFLKVRASYAGMVNGENKEVSLYNNGTAFAFMQRDGRTYFLTAEHVGENYPKSINITIKKPPLDQLDDYLNSLRNTFNFFKKNDADQPPAEEKIKFTLPFNSVAHVMISHDGKNFPVEYVCSDPTIDVSVYAADVTGIPFSGIFADEKDIHLGDIVRIVGYPFNSTAPTMTGGIISRLGSGKEKNIMFDSAVNHGNSGGAFWLFDDGYPIIGGLVTGYLNNLNDSYLGIGPGRIMDFLRANGLAPDEQRF